jgi:hypothetical protein
LIVDYHKDVSILVTTTETTIGQGSNHILKVPKANDGISRVTVTIGTKVYDQVVFDYDASSIGISDESLIRT